MRPVRVISALESQLPHLQEAEDAPRELSGANASGAASRLLRCRCDQRVDVNEARPLTLVSAPRQRYLGPEPGLIGCCARNDRKLAQLGDGRARNGHRKTQAPAPGRDLIPAFGHHPDVRGQQAGCLLVPRCYVRIPADADRDPPFPVSRGAGHDQVVNRTYPAPLEEH